MKVRVPRRRIGKRVEVGDAPIALARLYPRKVNTASGEGVAQMRADIGRSECFEVENALLRRKLAALWNVIAVNKVLFDRAQDVVQAIRGPK